MDYLELEYNRTMSGSVESAHDELTMDLSGSFMASVFTAAQQRSVTRKSEVDQYAALQPIGPLDDPIKWWAARSSTLPKLAGLAQKHLAIPATSVPCERLFSASGMIMNKKRTRLASGTFSKLVFCHANRKRYGTLFPDIDDLELDEEDEECSD